MDETMPIADVIRLAYQKDIIQTSWDVWWHYRDQRNATSHGDNEKRARQVVDNLESFNQELDFLITKLKGIYHAQY